jgi:hypothetical protein
LRLIPPKVTYNNVSYTVSGVTTSAFKGTKITSITLPDGITSLGCYCFSGCTNLTSITLPNSITSLDSYCFQGCTGLTGITLPVSITSVGSYCFINCSRLAKVTCQWGNLDNVSVGANAFNGISTEATLYVPKGTAAIYNVKGSWSDFKAIVEDDTNGINLVEQRGIMAQSNNGFLSVSGLGANEPVSLYTVSGMELGKVNAVQGTATFHVSTSGNIAILKIGKKALKILMK